MNTQEEARLLLEKNTLCSLQNLTVIGVSGPDAKRFLQGQLSCNLDEITDEYSSLAAHCTPKGRVIAVMRVFKQNNDYGLLINREIKSTLLTYLKKYALFSKVELQDWQETRFIFGVAGNKIIEEILLTRPLLDHDNNCILEDSRIWIRIPGTIPRVLLITGAKETTLWADYLQQLTLVPSDTWKLFDIRAGLPQIYPTTCDLFTPHQLNLHEINAISFNKGCYTGQEIIARMHYQGKLKQGLRQITVRSENAVSPGDVLVSTPESSSPIGYVIEAAMGPEGMYELLVSVKFAALESGEIYVRSPGKAALHPGI